MVMVEEAEITRQLQAASISPWYWLLRIPVVVIVMIGVLLSLFPPLFEESVEPKTPVDYLLQVIAIIAALSLVLPNSWTPKGWLFRIRLGILLLVAIPLSSLAIWFAIGVVTFEKHWSAIPFVVLVFLFIAIAAPTALVWRASWLRSQSRVDIVKHE